MTQNLQESLKTNSDNSELKLDCVKDLDNSHINENIKKAILHN